MTTGVHPARVVATPSSLDRTTALTGEPRADALILVLSLALLTAVWRMQDLFAPLGIIRPTITTTLLAALLFALDTGSRRRLAALRSATLGMAVVLLVILAIGAPVSIWPGGSIAFLARDFIPSIMLAVLIAGAARGVRDIEVLIAVLLAGAAIFSVYILVTVQVEPTGRLGRLRYYDVNDLALLIVSSIPLAVLMLRRGSGRLRTTFAVACLGIFVVTLVRSGSRGGFLAFVVVSFYLLVRYRALPARVRAGAVIGGMLLLLATGTDRYWQMMQTMLHPKSDYNWAGNTYDGRMEIWKRGLGYVGEHPALGVGADAFPVAEGELSTMARHRRELHLSTKWSVAHNAYIHIAAEGGLFAFAAFVGMLALAFRSLARVNRVARERGGDPRVAACAQALTGAFLGYAFAQFFISAQYFTFLYVLVGLVAATEKIARMGNERVPAA